MKLNKILKTMENSLEYLLKNEQDFETLALSASNIPESCCIFLDDVKYAKDIRENVTMVLTTEEIETYVKEQTEYKGGFCVVKQPRLLFFEIHNYLENSVDYVRPVFETKMGKACQISPLASISESNVVIGDNVIIEEFAVIRANTVIGNNSIVRAGAKIGGQGFEFKRTQDSIVSVAHLGGVIIGHHVEIQYNTCIDRAVYLWDNTVIGNYSKIDNLVHIVHAVKVEENVMIVAQSGIGGRTIIKPETWIGFGATVSNGLIIGRNARVNIGSVATRSVQDEQSVTGNFAIEHSKFIENLKNNR